MACLVFALTSSATGDTGGMELLSDFGQPEELERWYPVNDTVMGGVSRSRLRRTDSGTALFEGYLSLENNGGFAMVRTRPDRHDLSGHEGIALRVRGDGRRYRLRLRSDGRFDGVAYQAAFETEAHTWLSVCIPFSEFAPTYRGRPVPEAGPLDTSRVRAYGLMLADKQQGPFRLEIDWIKAYGEQLCPGRREASGEQQGQ